MSTVALNAQIRTERGKGGARDVRAAALCPAVVYGPGTEPVAVKIDPKVFLKLLHTAGENALIDLALTGPDAQVVETKKVIVRAIQYNPFKQMPNHVDFYMVNLERVIAVRVPLELTGTPAAVASKSATLTQQVHELHVECLPDRIPAKITADVSGLEMGRSLHVRELVVAEGVAILDPPELTVAGVAAIHAEAGVAPQLETAEPEVLRGKGGESEE